MLAKKNVFITGAAKRIGAEISKSLSTLDCNVVIHYNKSSASAKKLCREINKTKKVAICVKADLCIKDELEKAFFIAKKEFGYIDCVINNASIFEYDNLKTIKSKKWDKHISETPTFWFLDEEIMSKARSQSIEDEN